MDMNKPAFQIRAWGSPYPLNRRCGGSVSTVNMMAAKYMG